MALRGTLTHRKTRRLARLLGIPPVFALGILEALWHVTAEQCPDGAIGKMSNLDIAEEMFYEEDHDQLVKALIDAGWLDEDETHRLIVHDWSESADTSVHTYLAKRTMLFCDGVRPRLSDSTLSGQTKARIQAEYDQKHGQLKDTSPDKIGLLSDNSQTNPEPDPDPVPTDKERESASATFAGAGAWRPPSPMEVGEYMQLRGIAEPFVQAEKFIAHYGRTRWQTRNGLLTDWKAAVDGWQARDGPPGKPPTKLKETLEEATERRYQEALKTS